MGKIPPLKKDLSQFREQILGNLCAEGLDHAIEGLVEAMVLCCRDEYRSWFRDLKWNPQKMRQGGGQNARISF